MTESLDSHGESSQLTQDEIDNFDINRFGFTYRQVAHLPVVGTGLQSISFNALVERLEIAQTPDVEIEGYRDETMDIFSKLFHIQSGMNPFDRILNSIPFLGRTRPRRLLNEMQQLKEQLASNSEKLLLRTNKDNPDINFGLIVYEKVANSTTRQINETLREQMVIASKLGELLSKDLEESV